MKCFILMPFGGLFDSYYEYVFKPAILDCGIEVTRADEIYNARPIIEDIYESICFSDLIIADLTSRNANVNYELGFAHALEKPVIMITQELQDVPFDTKHIRVITYNPKDPNWQGKFKDQLTKTIHEVLRLPKKNLVWTNPNVQINDNLNRFLENIYNTSRANLSKISEFIVDPDTGNCKLNLDWTIETITNLSHLGHGIYIDEPGNIEVIEVIDKLNNYVYPTTVAEKSDKFYRYYMLFNELKPAGTTFSVNIKINAQNYLSNLIKNREGLVFHRTFRGTAIDLQTNIERYIFPKIPKFKKLRAVIQNHPDKSKINTEILPIKDGNNLILEIDFTTTGVNNVEFGALIKI